MFELRFCFICSNFVAIFFVGISSKFKNHARQISGGLLTVKLISQSIKQLFLHMYIEMDASSARCFIIKCHHILPTEALDALLIRRQFCFPKSRLEFALLSFSVNFNVIFCSQKPLHIVIMRAGQMTHISLTPKRWSGRGLLG